MQMHTARIAEKLEAELFKYPKARVMQLERELAFVRSRFEETDQELRKYQKKLHEAHCINAEVRKLHGEIVTVASQVSEQLMPATQKIVSLKKTIKELHLHLGASEN